MKEKYDYESENYVVDSILEIARRHRSNLDGVVARADKILNELGCATRTQVELLVHELQREEDHWLQLKNSRVGLPTLFSLGALIISIPSLLIAFIKTSDDILPSLFALLISVLVIIVLVFWGAEFRWFNAAGKSGRIHEIRELHHSLSAWLLLKGYVNEKSDPEKHRID